MPEKEAVQAATQFKGSGPDLFSSVGADWSTLLGPERGRSFYRYMFIHSDAQGALPKGLNMMWSPDPALVEEGDIRGDVDFDDDEKFTQPVEDRDE